ncbi:hypothetical protein E2562_027365 [Oryza meyeriana var. granulata]|uniref:Uncharacterized protein n=1 Tax=Oryza meyeriana var. granulata TaxID=110450 RepID=A0A6G1C8G9_9ORYZ|nr:hypothetical protein E2562_027365 [Oryza meyeriana var. granulata]
MRVATVPVAPPPATAVVPLTPCFLIYSGSRSPKATARDLIYSGSLQLITAHLKVHNLTYYHGGRVTK